MTRVKIDNRVKTLIENGANRGHRSLFVIVGEKSRDQAITLYHILTKTQTKTRPSVLWCYKNELGFSTHRKKRIKELQKLKKAGLEISEDNPLDLFLNSANVRWCYYKETHKILGQTYGMAVLQDFEAIQPNILARTIETVEAGGLVVILLNTLHSLKQLHTMAMDVHARYRTESHQEVIPRFNERFILSLVECKASCIVDDKFNILPICSHMQNITPAPKVNAYQLDPSLVALKDSIANKEPLNSLVALCKTADQADVVMKFTHHLAKKASRTTISLIAARGRGKSAALGLSIASAVTYHYSPIYVTSPSPENVQTLFEFAVKGLRAVHLTENNDFNIIRSNDQDQNNAIIEIRFNKNHKQSIKYIDPVEASNSRRSMHESDLLVIDEAAAIPLTVVKTLIGPQLIFLSSTVSGYEGTGRSLSLKLLKELKPTPNKIPEMKLGSELVQELILNEPIRYKSGDQVEAWLNNLLCLDAPEFSWLEYVPHPDSCELYYIDRDVLFSFHKESEEFLHHLMSLYVASHYKNSPNDLQMMSDAPAHHLFCLLPPGSKKKDIPTVLCFIQVCLEGEISKESILTALSQGKRAASGDLIPWTISRHFCNDDFASLSGARIIRIATNPNYQKMGYGSKAMQLLYDYYAGNFSVNLNETEMADEETNENGVSTKANKPLLKRLEERRAESLHYIGVSFGLTQELLKFWKINKFVPVYLRDVASEITGEHSCIVLRQIQDGDQTDWLNKFFVRFREEFLLSLHRLRHLSPQLALSIVRAIRTRSESNDDEKTRILQNLKTWHIADLEHYCKNPVDYRRILYIVPRINEMYFQDQLNMNQDLSAVQATIMLALGLLGKTVDQAAQDLRIEPTVLLGSFHGAVKKIVTHLSLIENQAVEREVEMDIGNAQLTNRDAPHLEPKKLSLAYELNKADKRMKKKLKKMRLKE